MVNDGVKFQKCLERTCAVEVKKTFPPRGKKNINYWWNEELSELRRTTLRFRIRAQRAVAACRDNAGHLVTAFKEAKRRLKRAIERSKEKMWKEFCATLDSLGDSISSHKG
jgi:two-component SAPR family response regulator